MIFILALLKLLACCEEKVPQEEYFVQLGQAVLAIPSYGSKNEDNLA